MTTKVFGLQLGKAPAAAPDQAISTAKTKAAKAKIASDRALRQKNVLIGVAILVVIALLPGRLVLHKRAQFLAKANQYNAQSLQLQAENNLARLVQQNPAYYRTEAQQLSQAVPSAFSLPQTLINLTNLANTAGVEWLTNSVSTTGGASPVPGTQVYTLTIGLQGSPAALGRYVQEIQQLPERMSVTAYSITYPNHNASTNGGNNTRFATASITANTYVTS